MNPANDSASNSDAYRNWRVGLRRTMRRIQHLCRSGWERPVVRASLYVFAAVVVSGLLLHFIEKGRGTPGEPWPYDNPVDTMWEVGVFLFSGYDATQPTTNLGRILSFVCLFSGIALVLMLTADLSSQLVATALAGQGRRRLRLRNHIVICGWHHTAHSLVTQLISRERDPRREIVVVDSQTSELQVHDPDVHLVKGDPIDMQSLTRANVAQAHTAIIPIDWNLSEDIQDSRTTLAALAIKSANEDIYSCAEVLHPRNKIHVQRTNVDEVICLGEFSQKLLSAAALSHGLSQLFEEVLTFNQGSEIYRWPLPPQLAGQTYRWLVRQASEHIQAVLLSVQRDNNVYTNPTGEFILQLGDFLFLMSAKHPQQIDNLSPIAADSTDA